MKHMFMDKQIAGVPAFVAEFVSSMRGGAVAKKYDVRLTYLLGNRRRKSDIFMD